MPPRLALLCALLLAGCTRPPETAVAEPPRPAEAAPLPAAPLTPAADSNAFAVNLYGVLARQPGNVFVSPESISAAFAMAYAGARGATAEQMAAALGFDADPARFHAAMGARLNQAQTDAPGVKLTLANALWAQQGLTLRDDYAALMRAHYDGAVRQVDFRRAPEAAARTINSWVAARTNNRIRELIHRENIKDDTALILTNAIWFKGDWRDPFDKAATRDGPFHTAAGPQTAPLMQRQGWYRHYDGGAFQAVELPYKDETLSMIVFLPKALDGLPQLEQQLTPAALSGWLQSVSTANGVPVIVTLPRVTVKARYELKRAFQTLGMALPFSDHADFSGITDDAQLRIDEAVHESFVAVDETGTEAAAATGVIMAPVSVPPPPVHFRADHPFLYVIRDNRSGTLLFMGRLETPAG